MKRSISLQTRRVSAQLGTTPVARLFVIGDDVWYIVMHIAVQDGMEENVFILQRLVALGSFSPPY
jgi:hypothetical protein